MRQHEFIKEDLSVPQLKKEITKKISQIEDFDLLDRIYQVLSHKDTKGKIERALAHTTQDSNLGDTDSIISDMMGSIATIEGSTQEKLAFVEALEKGKAVDVDALQMAAADFNQIFPMSQSSITKK